MAERPWRLDEQHFGAVREAGRRVALLPLGCTEPHNLHLPYGTDTIEADAIVDRACAHAWARGARMWALPAIPYGTVTNQRRCAMSMNLDPSTLHAVLRDLVASLEGHGVDRAVLVNAHGGNDLKPFLREMHGRTGVHLFLFDWFRAAADAVRDICAEPDDHAGEAETSIVLALRGDLVLRSADGALAADAGAVRPTRFEAINRGWISMTRPWHLLTTNTGAGDPHAATAAKGERLLRVLEERLGAFVAELAQAEMDAAFPFATD